MGYCVLLNICLTIYAYGNEENMPNSMNYSPSLLNSFTSFVDGGIASQKGALSSGAFLNDLLIRVRKNLILFSLLVVVVAVWLLKWIVETLLLIFVPKRKKIDNLTEGTRPRFD